MKFVKKLMSALLALSMLAAIPLFPVLAENDSYEPMLPELETDTFDEGEGAIELNEDAAGSNMKNAVSLNNDTAVTLNAVGFAGGDGTPGNPYQISTPEQLDSVRNNLSAHYIQINNINMTAATAMGGAYYNNGDGWEPIGSGSTSQNRFSGTYDGGGFRISGLKIYRTGTSALYVGLFGYSRGTIKNLRMEGGNVYADSINANSYAGGIVGCNSGGTITNCYNTGEIKTYSYSQTHSAYAGGIAGDNNGIITNCYNTGVIYANCNNYSYAGGVAGYNDSEITNCYNTGGVSSESLSSTTPSYAGGIVGDNSGAITDCYNTGNISAALSSYCNYAGGVAGRNDSGTIADCHNTGDISARNGKNVYAGGVAGYNYGTIINCYNTAYVSSSNSFSNGEPNAYSGGVAGYNYGTTANCKVANCYNTGEVSSYSYSGSFFVYSNAGGVVGYNESLVTNCYNAGEVAASGSGSGSANYSIASVGGIVGINYEEVANCYWNLSSRQTANEANRTNANKLGIGSGAGTTTSRTDAQMKDAAFVSLLNGNRGSGAAWALDAQNTNNGYPVFVVSTPQPEPPLIEGYSITAYDLPAGLSINGGTGAITGISAKAGTYYTVVAAREINAPQNVILASITIVIKN